MEVILAKLLQPDSDVIKQVHGFLRRKDSNGLERETDRGIYIKMQRQENTEKCQGKENSEGQLREEKIKETKARLIESVFQ